MDHEFFLNGNKESVQADWDGRELSIDTGDGKRVYAVTDLGGGSYVLRRDGRNFKVTAVKEENKIFVVTDNESYTYDLPSSKNGNSFEAADDIGDKSKIAAPMPGKVVKVLVSEGDTVEPKQKLVIVEAMKMENPLIAPFKATVKSIGCTEGELVDSETILVDLEEIQ